MSGTRIIDPDAFLETGAGRVWTPERNAEAWRCALETLRRWLEAGSVARLVIVCGLQGAGKSSWIARQTSESGTVYVDAALPGARHRAPIIALARSHKVAVEAVWIRTPLLVALERNRQRAEDRRVPEASIRSVDRLFAPPTPDEGFARVRVVEN
ncbi:Predicted kinase [Methylobacterium phyllostachyos]|uniref:Predicted kinase n=1 Tax=Methylobacterium phyllostachyos TaxID=582672 RepID=A0A1G9XAB9_9HYPH|nr:AAA family ATPase [Methylobacterium phyllostachyos]SDM93678.1 Predicted kinase [Methylobacterium phyllostachyos]